MTIKEIQDRLFELQDKKFNDFNKSLIPGMPEDYFIGIRTPALRNLAKELYKNENY